MNTPKKSLGQHWLSDEESLRRIVASADINEGDTVLEVGPGLGTLTELLCAQAKTVIAVEMDESLVQELKERVPTGNLTVVTGDILEYDLATLPRNYKVVANIPYYLTSYLLRKLWSGENPPETASLLIQKEVAERVTAEPGDMTVLAFSVQYYARATMLDVVPKELFNPQPQVDSAILQLKRRDKPYFEADTKKLFRLVKAGFSERRKKLANSLAGGLNMDKEEAGSMLNAAGISPNARSQELSLDDWARLYESSTENGIL